MVITAYFEFKSMVYKSSPLSPFLFPAECIKLVMANVLVSTKATPGLAKEIDFSGVTGCSR